MELHTRNTTRRHQIDKASIEDIQVKKSKKTVKTNFENRPETADDDNMLSNTDVAGLSSAPRRQSKGIPEVAITEELVFEKPVKIEKSFLERAADIFSMIPKNKQVICFKKTTQERDILLKKYAKSVTKYDDVRKILGYGPSLSNQLAAIEQPRNLRLLTVPLPKTQRLRTSQTHREHGMKPTGVVVVTNSRSPKHPLPPVLLYDMSKIKYVAF